MSRARVPKFSATSRRSDLAQIHGDHQRLMDMREMPMPVLARQIIQQVSEVLTLAVKHGDILNRVCAERRWDLVSLLLKAGVSWRRPASGHYTRPALSGDLKDSPLGTAVRQDDPHFISALGARWGDIHTEVLILSARLRCPKLGAALWQLDPPVSALDRVPPRTLFWNQAWLDRWIKAQPSWSGLLVFKASEWVGVGGWSPPSLPLPPHGRSPAVDASESFLIPDISLAPMDPLARALPAFERLASLCGPSVVRRPVARHGGGPAPKPAHIDWMSLVAAVLGRGDVGKARALARAHRLSPVLLTQMALEMATIQVRIDLRDYVGTLPEGPGPSRAAMSFLTWSSRRVPASAWSRAWGSKESATSPRTIHISMDSVAPAQPFPVFPLVSTFVPLFRDRENLAREALEIFQEAGCPLSVVQIVIGKNCPTLSKEIQVQLERGVLRRAAGLDPVKKKGVSPLLIRPSPRRRTM